MSEIEIPAIFMISHEDKLALPRKVEKMFKKYAGKKKLRHFKGEHSDAREYEIIKDGIDFLRRIERDRINSKQKQSSNQKTNPKNNFYSPKESHKLKLGRNGDNKKVYGYDHPRSQQTFNSISQRRVQTDKITKHHFTDSSPPIFDSMRIPDGSNLSEDNWNSGTQGSERSIQENHEYFGKTNILIETHFLLIITQGV